MSEETLFKTQNVLCIVYADVVDYTKAVVLCSAQISTRQLLYSAENEKAVKQKPAKI